MNSCKKLLLIVLLIASGCQQEQSRDVNAQTPAKVVQVAVEQVQRHDMVETFTLPGSLEAWEDVTLAAELSGPVRWIGPREGDQLHKGQEILRIDTDTLSSEHERNQVTFDLRSRKLERYRSLLQEQLVSPQEVDNLALSMEEARADLKQTELMLQKSVLQSPLAGVLDEISVDPGEYVNVGQPLARIVQVDRLKVNVDVPEKDVPFLHVGQDITIIPAVVNDKRPVYKLTGKLEYVAFTADEKTRTYRARIVIDNSGGLLRPGMIVRARFERQTMKQIVSAPLYAVLDRDDEKLVFVEKDGIAHAQKVVTGSSVGQRVVIHRGLESGQWLIVKGQQLLVDGARVDTGRE